MSRPLRAEELHAQKYTQPSPTSQVVVMVPVSKHRRVIVSRVSAATPGQKGAGDGAAVHGGGGPENMGARSSEDKPLPFYQAQPSWDGEQLLRNEYFGFAAPSTTPNLAGIPANNFRRLGDNHGGRG